jgi:hypothetical protein
MAVTLWLGHGPVVRAAVAALGLLLTLAAGALLNVASPASPQVVDPPRRRSADFNAIALIGPLILSFLAVVVLLVVSAPGADAQLQGHDYN